MGTPGTASESPARWEHRCGELTDAIQKAIDIIESSDRIAWESGVDDDDIVTPDAAVLLLERVLGGAD